MANRLTYRDENGKAWAKLKTSASSEEAMNFGKTSLERLAAYEDLGTVEELAELVNAKQDNRLAIFPKVKDFERKDFLDLMRDVRDDMTQEDRSVGIFASPDGELALMQTIINALEEQTSGTP